MAIPPLSFKNFVALCTGTLDGAAAVPVSASNPLPVGSPGGVLTVLTSITRPADTNVYAANDAYSDSTSAPTAGGFTLAGVARAAGKSAILTDLVVVNSNPAATPLQGELWIFDVAVTNVNDNAAFAISDAEALTLVAKVPFTMVQGVNNNHVHLQNLGIGVTTSGSANLRFLVKVLNAYTPASAEVLSFRAKFLPVD
jgi:hypothetical protein